MSKMMNFSEALIALKKGAPIKREAWKGSIEFITLQSAQFYPENIDEDEDSSLPIIHTILEYVNREYFIWSISQEDILAMDWTKHSL